MDPCMFHGPFSFQLFLTLKLLLLLYYFDKINGSAFFSKLYIFFSKKAQVHIPTPTQQQITAL